MFGINLLHFCFLWIYGVKVRVVWLYLGWCSCLNVLNMQIQKLKKWVKKYIISCFSNLTCNCNLNLKFSWPIGAELSFGQGVVRTFFAKQLYWLCQVIIIFVYVVDDEPSLNSLYVYFF